MLVIMNYVVKTLSTQELTKDSTLFVRRARMELNRFLNETDNIIMSLPKLPDLFARDFRMSFKKNKSLRFSSRIAIRRTEPVTTIKSIFQLACKQKTQIYIVDKTTYQYIRACLN